MMSVLAPVQVAQMLQQVLPAAMRRSVLWP